MKKLLLILFLIVLVLCSCRAASGMEVSNAWTRPTMIGDNGAVYFLLQNHSAGADELTGVSAQVAEAVEIHESRMEGDIMQMRQVKSLPVAGKESIEFGPGGYHVMLVGLKQDLKTGEHIQVTLHFKEHSDMVLIIPVHEMAQGEAMEEH